MLVVGSLLPWASRVTPTVAVLCLGQVAICVQGIVRSCYPVLRPIGLIVFVFTFSWLGVASLYQMSHKVASWGDSNGLGRPGTNTALFLDLAAAASLFLGFFVIRGPHLPMRRGRPPEAFVPARVVPMLCLITCLLLVPGAVAAAGGLGAMFTSRTQVISALGSEGISIQQSGGVGLALVRILPTALAVSSAYLFLRRVQVQRRGRSSGHSVAGLDVACLVVSLMLVGLLANPFINARQVTAVAFGSLALLALQPRGRVGGVTAAAAALFATFVAYPLFNLFRGDGVSRSLSLRVLGSVDFDGFQQVINTVEYVRDEGHTWGRHSLSALLYPIPRAWWHTKARPASIDVAEHRGYYFTNLSLPFHAELYLEFGIVGMVVILIGLGILGARCDRAWVSAPDSRPALFVPYASIATLLVIRGPLGSTGPVYLTVLGILALATLRRSRARHERFAGVARTYDQAASVHET